MNEYGPSATVLAGGTDLIVRLRTGRAIPAVVIDLKRVPALQGGIQETGTFLRIGANTVMTDLIADERVRSRFPALAEAAHSVGSVQIRNRATLVGNVCNASPAADTAPALLVYEAVLNLVSESGPRCVPLQDFFAGPGRTVIQRGELVESIDLPLPTVKRGACFERLTRRRGVDLATINLCCLVKASGQTLFAYGAVAPTPLLLRENSGKLADPHCDHREKEALLQSLIARTSPITDVRAEKDYRSAMLLVHEPSCAGNCSRTSSPSGGRPVIAAEVEQLTMTFTVNGEPHTAKVYPHHTLLEVLRDQFGLTGTKECCAQGECGACTVLLNGRAVNSCLVLAIEADEGEVVTIEGLAEHGKLDALQQAFLDQGAVQCGFCVPGMVMSAKYLLNTNPHPTREEVQEALAGNLCRCAGYYRILEAVADVSEVTHEV